MNCDELFERYKVSIYGSYINCVNKSYIPSYTYSPGSSAVRQESISCELIEPSIIAKPKPKWCLEYSSKSTKEYLLKHKLSAIITENETGYGHDSDVYYSTEYTLKK